MSCGSCTKPELISQLHKTRTYITAAQNHNLYHSCTKPELITELHKTKTYIRAAQKGHEMPSPYSDAGHFEHLTVRLVYLMLDAKVLSHTAGHAITRE